MEDELLSGCAERLEEEDTFELPELLLLSTELLLPELLSTGPVLLPDLSGLTAPELRADRLSTFGASGRRASGFADSDLTDEEALSGAAERDDSIVLPEVEALSGAVAPRDDSITLPEEEVLSGLVARDDSILRSEVAALSGAAEREALPAVEALSGAMEREDSTLLSE